MLITNELRCSIGCLLTDRLVKELINNTNLQQIKIEG